MDSERFKQIEELFIQACELPESQREAFVDSAKLFDESIKAEVISMLRADIEVDHAQQAVQQQACEVDICSHTWQGQTVDRYLVDREIASGGMGSVYLAHRVDKVYQQKVAIKFLTSGLFSSQARQRFLAERQILAKLNHPNIAQLLDGGTTQQGVPYLVMEFVDGLAIDEYADQHQLTIKQRLLLVLKVCEALQYAHQNLIVHRDIKASNILVDAQGEVKLLDFGIAKILDDSDIYSLEGESLAKTLTAMRLLTPEYASPEQVRGDPVSTATDVYGVGVLMYRLLSGEFPLSINRNRPQELEASICQSTIVRPSSRVSSHEDPNIARLRGLSPKQLARSLKGDLDNIILYALRKEPSRRYATVNALATDLNQYLKQRPISARRDSLAYRLSRFYQRNQAVVIAASVTIAIISGLLTFYTSQLQTQRDRAFVAEQAAKEKAESLQVTTDFLISMFTTANPRETGGPNTKAITVLNQGFERIDQAMPVDSLSKAKLLQNMGLAYMGLFELERSKQALNRSLAIYEVLDETDSLQKAQVMHQLGDSYRKSNQTDKAIELLQKALQIRRKHYLGDHESIADSYNNLAQAVVELGDLDKAIDWQKQSIAMHRRLDPDAAIFVPLNNLSLLLGDNYQFSEALRLADEAYTNFKSSHKQGDKQGLITIQLNRGMLLTRSGYPERAIDALLEIHPIAENINTVGNNESLVLINRELAQAYHAVRDFPTAEQYFEQALLACERLDWCNDSLLPGIVYKYQALMFKDMGQYVSALERIEKAYVAYQKYTGKSSKSLALVYLFKAEILKLNGQAVQARSMLADFNKIFGAENKFNRMYRTLLESEQALEQGAHQTALTLLQPVLEFHRNYYGIKSPLYLRASRLQQRALKIAEGKVLQLEQG